MSPRTKRILWNHRSPIAGAALLASVALLANILRGFDIGVDGAVVSILAALAIGASTGFLIGLVAESGDAIRVREATPFRTARLMRLAEDAFAREGWRIVSARPGHVVFSREGRIDVPLAALFFLVGVVPGVLYLMLARREIVATVAADARPGGSTLELYVSRRAGGGSRAAIGLFATMTDVVRRDGRGGRMAFA